MAKKCLCIHYTPDGDDRGVCAIGEFGGRPQIMDCLKRCVKFEGPSRGLGDTVAKALSAVGIEKKSGCGCAKRQIALNQAVPYKKDDV